MTHWCRDIPRDEAVRAAEDNRPGPLPTLEECIEHVTERRPVDAKGGVNVTGLRTERVTLEIKHFDDNDGDSVYRWNWSEMMAQQGLGINESVRIVEEAHFDDLAQVAMERDAAIRERDEAIRDLRSVTAERAKLEEQLESVACRAATAENRVAELESAKAAAIECVEEVRAQREAASDRCEAAETALRQIVAIDYTRAASGAALDPVLRQARLRDESRTEAYVASLDDASGAAGSSPAVPVSSKPVAWAFVATDGAIVHVSTFEPVPGTATVAPLYSAPQPAKGWLTAEEREAVEYFSEFCDTNIVPDEWSEMSEKLRALLARSSPPEVVLPAPPFDPSNVAYSDWMMCLSAVRSYLAAAGVTVKEVGSE
jgi:hypothetical protein